MAQTQIREDQLKDATLSNRHLSASAAISESKIDLAYTTSNLSTTLWQGIANAIASEDHSTLLHLDYASAGHTGFVGTGVVNTYTQIQVMSSGLSISTIVSTAGATFGGLVYAPYFQGDGSKLTNILGDEKHSDLQNLDYSNAGHTNFARTNGINTFDGIQTFSSGFTSTGVSIFNNGLSTTSINSSGIINYVGNRPTRNIVLTPSGGISATTNGPAQTKIAGTNFEYYVLDYDAVTSEKAYWNLSIPYNYADNTNVEIKVYWKESTAESGTNVVWSVGKLTLADGSVWDSALAYTSLIASNTKNDNTKTIVASGTIVNGFGSGTQENDLVVGIQRDVSDTYTADARFLKAVLTYRIKE
jgi:hypothetical protein